MRRGRIIWAAVLLAVVAGAAAPPAQARYLTLLFSKAEWSMQSGCKRLHGSVPLSATARALHQRGRRITVSVVVSFTRPRGSCSGGTLHYASWRGLARLHHRYGAAAVSEGVHYVNFASLGRSAQQAESCGSLQTFYRHGFRRPWGLFAYPGDSWSAAAQANVVATCFAYGRTYNHATNVRRHLAAPWFQHTWSLDGGACNVKGRACYAIHTPVYPAHYTPPSALLGGMSPRRGEWRVLQAYRLVKGTRRSGRVQWDCTSRNWRLHWTTRIEVYCYRDYLWAVNRIPRGVKVRSPGAIAVKWGRAAMLGLG